MSILERTGVSQFPERLSLQHSAAVEVDRQLSDGIFPRNKEFDARLQHLVVASQKHQSHPHDLQLSAYYAAAVLDAYDAFGPAHKRLAEKYEAVWSDQTQNPTHRT